MTPHELHEPHRPQEPHEPHEHRCEIFTLPPLDPWHNLGVEEFLLKQHPNCNVIIVWKNPPAVIIGAYQNPWKECRLNSMADHGVAFVRRPSGGGAVYHDQGNINISFIRPREHHNPKQNLALLTRCLSRFGISAVINERNDLLAEGKKISGSAYKYTRTRVLHHCTLLIDADLSLMRRSLRIPSNSTTPAASTDVTAAAQSAATTGSQEAAIPITSKGINSVGSPVINLASLADRASILTDPEITASALAETMKTDPAYPVAAPRTSVMLPRNMLYEEQVIRRTRELTSWEWLYGKTPDFSFHPRNTFSWGEAGITIKTHRGLITDVSGMFPPCFSALNTRHSENRYSKIPRSDSLNSDKLHSCSPHSCSPINQSLIGKQFSRDNIIKPFLVLKERAVHKPDNLPARALTEFINFLESFF